MHLRTILLFSIIVFLLSSLWISEESLGEESLGEENLGKISIDNILVEAQLHFPEGALGGFYFDKSSISILWEKSPWLSSRVRFGSKKLINPPQIFQETTINDIGFYEAYGQYEGIYGRIRMGLIPLDFGVNGRTQEYQIDFPRRLIFSRRIIGLRDLGLSYFIEHQGFYTKLAIHNGESGQNLDGDFYCTASWGWHYNNIELGLSGHAGTTQPHSTLLQSSHLAGVDLSLKSRWQVFNPYFLWYKKDHFQFLAEYTYGSLDQEFNPQADSFQSWYMDFNYILHRKFKLMTRYDYLNPSLKVKRDQRHATSLGLVFLGRHSNSRWIFVTTVISRNQQKHISEAQYTFTWKLTPKIL